MSKGIVLFIFSILAKVKTIKILATKKNKVIVSEITSITNNSKNCFLFSVIDLISDINLLSIAIIPTFIITEIIDKVTSVRAEKVALELSYNQKPY